MDFPFTAAQDQLIQAPLNAKILLRGPFGVGKTTAAVGRVLFLVASGIPAESILVLTPQRALQDPYTNALLNANLTGGLVTPATLGGLARRMVDLFWPLVAESAGFAQPDLPPTFLTLESAQYYMARIIRPKLEEGWFQSVNMDRNRLYSQVIDNLNKAALVGLPLDQIGNLLTSAWGGDPAQQRVYADAQACVSLFREYCLANNLLDFSLQLEVFANRLWAEPVVRDYLHTSYRHLIYDNVEEDGPMAHDLIADWLPSLDSALMIADNDGGYRKFLGADPLSAQRFTSLLDETIEFNATFVQNEAILGLEMALLPAITGQPVPPLADADSPEPASGSKEPSFRLMLSNYLPELLDQITDQIRDLINDGASPSEIVILAPYLSDSLRFALMNRLAAADIAVRSHRPSRSLRDEPAAQALLTLAALAHPAWAIPPGHFDIAYALTLALGMDLVRAQLLTDIAYRKNDLLVAFDDLGPDAQERITYTFGGRYTTLRQWIFDYRAAPPLPLDHFLRKLFGEVLSQPGFGFSRGLDDARVAASLVESAQKFRQSLPVGADDYESIGREYLTMLREGVLAAQYLQPYQNDENAVFVAPATTFSLMNRPATYQFWLDVGSSGWAERLSQPLTQPYVLSRQWIPGKVWTDTDDVATEVENLARLAGGLLRRCRHQIFICLSGLDETGYEQRGPLLRAFQRVLSNTRRESPTTNPNPEP